MQNTVLFSFRTLYYYSPGTSTHHLLRSIIQYEKSLSEYMFRTIQETDRFRTSSKSLTSAVYNGASLANPSSRVATRQRHGEAKNQTGPK